jgi:hypothetical protein
MKETGAIATRDPDGVPLLDLLPGDHACHHGNPWIKWLTRYESSPTATSSFRSGSSTVAGFHRANDLPAQSRYT